MTAAREGGGASRRQSAVPASPAPASDGVACGVCGRRRRRRRARAGRGGGACRGRRRAGRRERGPRHGRRKAAHGVFPSFLECRN
eukprot:6475740-Prymnesium_polylepis.1